MVELIVPGMSCSPCARAVTNAIQSVDPGASVDVDLAAKLVSIDSDQDIGLIRTAIEEAGYLVEPQLA